MSNESIIQVFEGINVRIVWNEEEQEYYFSIADVVQVLTDSTDVKQYIKRMRARDPELNLRWGTICTPTRMKATDGKYYQTQAATLEGVFRVIQSIPSKKAEPLKQWLAEQYAAGTPVTVYYPLAIPVEENWPDTTYNTSVYIPQNQTAQNP